MSSGEDGSRVRSNNGTGDAGSTEDLMALGFEHSVHELVRFSRFCCPRWCSRRVSDTVQVFSVFFFKRKPQRNQSSEMSFVPNQSYILVKATDMSSFTSQMRKTSVPTFEQIKLHVN